ncbi:TPA: DUF551 domain-containing protein [Klebsiella pneumoniae]|nr:DUF551 domain-containing protein [Klebsiella pneumoniae]
MTSKLTITDERVISVIERLEHYACNLKWTNVRGAQDLLTAADGLRELQERRKAAMDSEPAMESEPVAIENFRSAMEGIGHIRRTLEETFGGLHGTHVEPDVLAECKAICDAIYAAYGHAQPAPVVPEEATTENIQVISGALIPRNGGWYKMDENECHMAVDVWNACRAAMLQAGNSPVIPDGYRLQPISEYEAMCATVNSDEWPQRWIPVSERMPEDRTQVILWDAEIGEVISGHYSHKTHTFYHCGDAIQNEITHWMPLPAAPQEVK